MNDVAIALYRLVILRRRAATSFRFYASTDEEAVNTASAIVANAGISSTSVALTLDGRRIADEVPLPADRPGPCP